MAADPLPASAALASPPEGQRDGDGSPKRKGLPAALVRYGAMAWVGEFAFKPGMLGTCQGRVVVQTERGIELGEPLRFCCEACPISIPEDAVRSYVQSCGPEFCRPNAGRILRQATPQDMDEHLRLNAHPKEDLDLCAELAAKLKLDMKVVAAEHLLGGERIVFYFRSEGRVDFRELVKELAHRYHTRIEMRQVGARDEARLVADWEVCGRECCCKNFLKKLRPVNMKMAKLQKSTLDPSKVSGRCGRLRCCLRYEHDGYTQLAAKLPRKGTRIRTALGVGTVIDHQVLTQLVLMRTDELNEYAVPLDEILEFNLLRPPSEPAGKVAKAPAEMERQRPARVTYDETEDELDRPGAGGSSAGQDEEIAETDDELSTELQPGPAPSDPAAAPANRPRGMRRRRGGRRRNRRRPGPDREPATGDS